MKFSKKDFGKWLLNAATPEGGTVEKLDGAYVVRFPHQDHMYIAMSPGSEFDMENLTKHFGECTVTSVSVNLFRIEKKNES